ncbi:PREDICTED: lipase 3-like [Ceratosolen solmsi marchali]|uniref:Lipase n=1 Tax=Ceratosolen solmsi marchali TaxID=326594 RepID=A0AAJ6YK89_9HYME|nr:PREDICTED: lipase 3-like [Ceratosolen solmsi marchali]
MVCANSTFYNIAASLISGGPRIYKKDANSIASNNEITNDNIINSAAMINQENYPSETHIITTEDGYILTIFRIPGALGSIPVFLQHGLLESSSGWLIAGKNKALAYILSDNGYDVWLGNARGNTFSRKHQTLSTSDPRFWNFSWQELGLYDLPAIITYISELKNDSLFCVGHSMAATTFSVMAIERPEVAKNIKAMITLAPATYLHHIKGPVKLLSFFWRELQRISNALGIYEVFPRNIFVDNFAQYICKKQILRNIFCSNSLFLIAGYNPEQLDYSLLSKIWSDFPSGTSMKLFIHWLQQMTVNKLRKFDYGSRLNLEVYNNSRPPSYDLSKIQVPVAVFWSENDWLVDKKDVQYFYNQIPIKLGNYNIKHSKFNHFDFLWAVDAPELVYYKILQVMADYKNQIIK